MSGRKPNFVIDLIEKEEGRVSINLVTPPDSPVEGPIPVKIENNPSPPEPKVVTSGPATSVSSKLDGVKVVESASAKAGAAAEARRASVGDWYHYENTKNAVSIAVQEAAAKKSRENARALWDAGNGISDNRPEPVKREGGSATTVVKSEPGAGGSATTVVKPEPGAGGSAVDQGATTDEWSEEEERPRAGGKMRVHKPPGPRRKPYER